MVGDAKVGESQIPRGFDHLGQGGSAIGLGGVIEKGAPQIVLFDEPGKIPFARGVEFAPVFPESRFDELKSQFGVDVALLPEVRGGIVALGACDRLELILVERQLLLESPGAQFDVVLPAPGEVDQGERPLAVGDGSQVALQSTLEADGGLGPALGEDLPDTFKLCEKGRDDCGIRGGHEEVEIVDRFPAASIGARDLCAANIRMLPENSEDPFGIWSDLGEEVVAGETLMHFDGTENLLFALLPKPGEFAHLPGLAGALQPAQGGDGEFFVEGLDLPGTESL